MESGTPIVNASISIRPIITPDHVSEEKDLFAHAAWVGSGYIGFQHVLNPLEQFSFSKSESLIAQDALVTKPDGNLFTFVTWKKIASGDLVIYVVTRAIYCDKWGKLPEVKSCSLFSAKDNFAKKDCWGQYQQ